MQTSMDLKQRIARQFSRAAADYDQAADVQWQVAKDALKMLKPSQGVVLDIGAGTGRVTQCLQPQHAKVIGLDLAEGMLQFARQRSASQHQAELNWIAGDAEQLPLADNSIQALFSSMALQWCESIPRVFNECFRVMDKSADGVLAIMSQGSFKQWQRCWTHSQGRAPINPFPSHDLLCSAATQAGFKVMAKQQEYVTFHTDVRQLIGSIKSIGANVKTHMTSNDCRPLTRQSLLELNRHYEAYRNEQGLLPLSYQISFLQLTKQPD
ncbi:methyltransferase domain-containing protein [Neptunicella sp.]|uniref:methyltransferase domain-containing protein n=1 Tax=Neptunicella sp. TaxID=2125986 RepID=UPI003F6903CC